MLEQNISLKPYNTFGIDVQAESFAKIDSIDKLQNILSDTKIKQNLSLILGGGSNILLTKDVQGLVLKNDIDGIDIIEEDSTSVVLEVGAGVVWHSFVLWCIDKGYGGLENLSLIPGNVGASPMQNIGAYGVEIKDCFESLDALHIEDNVIHTFDKSACEFGYRESVFKRALKGQYVICKVRYKLSKTPKFNTSYGAIQQELERMGVDTLSLKAISDAVIAIRQSKLPDPKEIGNSGSFFKNPVVPITLANKIKEDYPEMPSYPIDDDHVKLAAGWLIEKCGWKGYRKDDYGVHAKQALVLVNYGKAKGSDIYNLSSEILASVHEKFGVQLEREVNIL